MPTVKLVDGEYIFTCPFCHNTNSTDSSPRIEDVFFDAEGEYTGCNCCGNSSKNVDDYAEELFEENRLYDQEERYECI